MSFMRIGDKIRLLEVLGIKDKHSGNAWNIRSNGIRTEDKGPTDQAIRDWIEQKHSPRETLVVEMVEVLNTDFVFPSIVEVEHFSDRTDLSSFMTALGYPTAAGHKAEAALWAEQHLPPNFAVDSKARDETLERTYSGLYEVVRKAAVDGKYVEAHLRLAITHAAPISTRKSEKRRFFNAMLNVPAPDGGVFRYRGAFTRKMPMMTWLFFQDDSDEPDMMVLMTDKGDFDTRKPMKGHLLTPTEGPNYRSVPWEVEVRWIRRFESLADAYLFLGDATVIEQDQKIG